MEIIVITGVVSAIVAGLVIYLLLKSVVDGLTRDIRAFQERLTNSDVRAAKDHTQLQEKIVQLVNQTNAVTSQAANLADAIRGEAQLTGEWGEIQLKRVLEAAGLKEGDSFTYQETFFDEDTGRKSKRTDFVIKMPGERNLIIDSKNTVGAAMDYHQARTEEEKREALEAIARSVEAHLKEIIAAEYTKVVPNAFPVVLMYIPVDEVYILAMKAKTSAVRSDELLREYAARHNIVLVNSASVVPVMRLIEMMWESESAQRNANEIIVAAQELLRRCNVFAENFQAVGAALEEARMHYADAESKLIDASGRQSIQKAVKTLIDLKVVPVTKFGKPLPLNDLILDAHKSDEK